MRPALFLVTTVIVLTLGRCGKLIFQVQPSTLVCARPDLIESDL